MRFSERLKEIRIKKGLLQGKVAKLAGISQCNLCNYESGKREPCISILVKIASALGVSTDYLLGVEEEIKRCPFCGGKAEVKGSNGDYWVRCVGGDDCEIHPETGCYYTADEAIAIWNRRAG